MSHHINAIKSHLEGNSGRVTIIDAWCYYDVLLAIEQLSQALPGRQFMLHGVAIGMTICVNHVDLNTVVEDSGKFQGKFPIGA